MSSGQPIAVSRLAATLEGMSVSGTVIIGSPDHSRSHPVVWPLHTGESRHRSARPHRAMWIYLPAHSVKIIRLGSTPICAAYFRRLSAPYLGKRSNQRTLFLTRFRIFIQSWNVVGSILYSWLKFANMNLSSGRPKSDRETGVSRICSED